MNVACEGEMLTLCPERALFWPARRTLVIADTHFGKDEIFRRAGLPIPSGISQSDLGRLTHLVRRHEALRLIVLGDFFHGNPLQSQSFQVEFGTWLDLHASLEIDVIAGNHDRHGGQGTRPERLRWRREPHLEGPFALMHHARRHPTHYALGGHVHPVVRLRALCGDRARLPVFWFGPDRAVMPAFGSFTGGANIRPAEGERVFAIAGSDSGSSVVEIAASVGRQRRGP